MVVREGTQPLTVQSWTRRLREAQDWPKVTQLVAAEPARTRRPLDLRWAPASVPLSPKAGASAP